jgi:hypothetical protein
MILQGLIYGSAQARDERTSSLLTEAHDMRERAVWRGHLLVRGVLLDRQRPPTDIHLVPTGTDTIKKITTRTWLDHALGSTSPFLCPPRHTVQKTS